MKAAIVALGSLLALSSSSHADTYEVVPGKCFVVIPGQSIFWYAYYFRNQGTTGASAYICTAQFTRYPFPRLQGWCVKKIMHTGITDPLTSGTGIESLNASPLPPASCPDAVWRVDKTSGEFNFCLMAAPLMCTRIPTTP